MRIGGICFPVAGGCGGYRYAGGVPQSIVIKPQPREVRSSCRPAPELFPEELLVGRHGGRLGAFILQTGQDLRPPFLVCRFHGARDLGKSVYHVVSLAWVIRQIEELPVLLRPQADEAEAGVADTAIGVLRLRRLPFVPAADVREQISVGPTGIVPFQ